MIFELWSYKAKQMLALMVKLLVSLLSGNWKIENLKHITVAVF